ncbi:MAG TPA: CBS domain-containing protein [Egibacteraceae bacterium]
MAAMRVREWMSPDPVTAEPTTTVAEARHLLHYYGIRHLPVVEDGRVVGMVSDRDLRQDPSAPRNREADERELAAVMSSPAHVVDLDASVTDAARLMLSRRISALPVVDGPDRRLVGMITTTDCLLASLSPQPSA